MRPDSTQSGVRPRARLERLPLRVERGDAWAELRQAPDGGVVVEMRDPTHHWVLRVVQEAISTLRGSEWWFLVGAIPDRASAVEVVAGGKRYRGGSHAGCWLAVLPREAVIGGIEIVALDSRGRSVWGQQR